MSLSNVSISALVRIDKEEKLSSPTTSSISTEASSPSPAQKETSSGGAMPDSGFSGRSGSVARGHALAQSRLQTFQERYNSPDHPSLRDDGAVTTPSNNTVTFLHDDDEDALKPTGKWRCCKCHRGHDVYSFAKGRHPVSILNCVCTHRSCTKCTLKGLIKQFVPMTEPEVVPLSEDSTKAIRFGVFCDGCGVSWRAQKVQDEATNKKKAKSTLLRISAIPRRLTHRGAHPLERIRSSQSMHNLSLPRRDTPLAASKSVLNLRALSNEMEKEHGEQAELVSVRFAGIRCTCGLITDHTTSLCFQVVDPPKDFHNVQFAQQMTHRHVAGFTSTLKDEARGHRTPTITLMGSSHPNPLMSNPVKDIGLLSEFQLLLDF
ncbi:hypothetical protein EJ02DRAFT_373146 [Clathrospora elynae]|uniref:Probable double zinc ribbon domain-containing protein n=1 Tax=Clathrospora elynae TaxID=706981 RepID=A0A6A5T3I7_9PLEO|nr:hypothetical protein EJ02DRAFT_373146 [Clathrospora elynae]